MADGNFAFAATPKRTDAMRASGAVPAITGSMRAEILDLDLRTLGYLDVITQEGSVSKAAMRLGMSQPGLSTALAKLRRTLNDALLVRTPQGMAPTECATTLIAYHADMVSKLNGLLSNNVEFDPRTSKRVFSVECIDYVLANDVARLISLLREEAPGIQLRIRPFPDRSFREHLETGYSDLIIGYMPDLDGTLRTARLRNLANACIVKKGHPTIGEKITLDEYLAGEHVSTTLGGDCVLSAGEEAVLVAVRDQPAPRRVPVLVQSMFAIPHIVAQTDLIGTVPYDLAVGAAKSLPIRVLESPLPDLDWNISMAWHARSEKDPAHRWLRYLIRTKRRLLAA